MLICRLAPCTPYSMAMHLEGARPTYLGHASSPLPSELAEAESLSFAHADVLPAGTNPQNQYTRSVDIFAFGLCVLELATKQKLDSHNAAVWPELLETVQDDETRSFIHRCVPLRCLLAADAGFSTCFLLTVLLQA